jgi:penicillin-binding protein 1B
MAVNLPSVKNELRHISRLKIRSERLPLKRSPRRVLYYLSLSTIIVALITTVTLSYFYLNYLNIIDKQLASGYLTSRTGIYAAPRILRVGSRLSQEDLVKALRRAGYIDSDTETSEVWSGRFSTSSNRVEIHSSRSDRNVLPERVEIGFNKGRIASIKGDNSSLEFYILEPELLSIDASMKTDKSRALGFDDIPKPLIDAIISIEDRRFFEHHGFDIKGILRAIWHNTNEAAVSQGGSTITQQLVKNIYLSPERTIRRKLNEALLATALEQRLSKEDIFALYCNEIYLGQRGAVAIRGVEDAARIYFGKELKNLSLAEAATIAGMIRSPGFYAPDRSPQVSKTRRNLVLDAMLRDGKITGEEASITSNEEIKVAPYNPTQDAPAAYVIDYINRTVQSKLDNSRPEDVGELRIYTTIDPDLQQIAEQAIKSNLERLDKIYHKKGLTPQAALVAIDPHTGHVLAMVGGRSYRDSQLNRATDARRQPGSVFKPFVYAEALESGISPLSRYMDAPQTFKYDRRASYRPANYGDTYSMNEVTMYTGLVKSLNVVTVDIAMRTGLRDIADRAEQFGLPRPEPFPSLALGTTETTPLEIASAYTPFANGGKLVKPVTVTRAVNIEGDEIIKEERSTQEQVIKPTTAYMITDMLTGVIDNGTARAARGSIKGTAYAGKTGTSRDGWFVGYTPNLVCAVWIGFDDNKALGLTGAEAALPAWVQFMQRAIELRPDLGEEEFEKPAGINRVEIDLETGQLATYSCPNREIIAVPSETISLSSCYKHISPLYTTNIINEVANSTSEPLEEDSEPIYSSLDGPPSKPRREEKMNDHYFTTQVEVDNEGHKTLVNEIEVTEPTTR